MSNKKWFKVKVIEMHEGYVDVLAEDAQEAGDLAIKGDYDVQPSHIHDTEVVDEWDEYDEG